MAYSELAFRYASALFDLATQNKATDSYLTAIQTVSSALQKDESINKFISSPLVRSQDKVQAIEAALKSAQLPAEVLKFVLLLAQKNRLTALSDIVEAYQGCLDKQNGVTRGLVKSAAALSDKHKAELQSAIEKVINKKVVLKFTQDSALIGGLTAQVGSLTFDDALLTHVNKIKEDLTRRIN